MKCHVLAKWLNCHPSIYNASIDVSRVNCRLQAQYTSTELFKSIKFLIGKSSSFQYLLVKSYTFVAKTIYFIIVTGQLNYRCLCVHRKLIGNLLFSFRIILWLLVLSSECSSLMVYSVSSLSSSSSALTVILIGVFNITLIVWHSLI